MSTGTKVFVGNLAYSTTEEDLETAFGKCGKVIEAKVVRRGNRSKGYGFVNFEDENDAQKSVDALDKVELNGRSINVQLSTSTNTGDEDGDGDSQVRRNDYNRPRYNNNNNYRRNNNSNYGGGRYNNNNSNFRKNNWNNRDNYDNRGNRDNYDNRGNRDNYDNRDNRGNRGSPSGRRTYSLRKNSDSDNNNENRRRYTKSTAEKVASATVVFVANLPYSFYDEDLVDLFKQCGDIKTAHVVRTRGKSKGYGFVEFQTHEGQVAALEKMDNLPVENSRGEERPLSVKVAMQEGESEQGSGNNNKNDDEDDDDEEKNDD